MLTVEEWMDVKMLAQQGHSARAIARITGYSRNTVARLLQQAAPQPFQQPPRPSKLDPFKPYLQRRCAQYPLSAVRLLEEIRPMGFDGSLCILQRFLATLRCHQRAQAQATVRFETPPGHQAQVDWAHCGSFLEPGGERLKLSLFVMVLGFSRMLYIEFTTSMALSQLIACHLEAFAFFGGWTQEILYDNMAQVKLPSSSELNPLFGDFAHYYGFVPRTCRVRRPRTKGKVERIVDYVKENFLLARTFADLADLNAQGRHWLTHTANVRIHSTTGQRPIDLLSAEKLTPMESVVPYRFAPKSARKVSVEGFIHLDRSRYSVPPEYVGQTLLVEEGEQRVIVRAGELIVADHPRAPQPGACVVQKEHVAAFWKLCLPPGHEAPPARAASPVAFQEGVARRPLAAYEEAARWAEAGR
jgi:transposase